MGVGGSSGMVVLAVDDEEPALRQLAAMLGADDAVGAVLTASDALGALRILDGTARRPAGCGAVDAVFLDVRMPGLDGMELARIVVAMAAPPSVVFVTAHEGRAVEAFEIGAVDYLLKPLCPLRLSASVARVGARRPARVRRPSRRGPEAEEMLPVELTGTVTLVPRSSVRYVEARGDYTCLHTTDGAAHVARIPLSVLEERWSRAPFIRIHRSYLVAVPLVTALRACGSSCVLRLGHGIDAVELPVSRRHARAVRERLAARTLPWSALGAPLPPDRDRGS